MGIILLSSKDAAKTMKVTYRAI